MCIIEFTVCFLVKQNNMMDDSYLILFGNKQNYFMIVINNMYSTIIIITWICYFYVILRFTLYVKTFAFKVEQLKETCLQLNLMWVLSRLCVLYIDVLWNCNAINICNYSICFKTKILFFYFKTFILMFRWIRCTYLYIQIKKL